VLVISAGVGVTWLATTLPKTEGFVRLKGLTGPVQIFRDKRGIPHIYAATLNETYRGLGFTHAQDRFAQMELMRRHGSGNLAGVIGIKGVPSDRFMRTLGFNRLVRVQLRGLSKSSQTALAAYAAGVNDWLKHRRATLPLEMLLMGYTPKPWKPEDSLIWGRVMAMWLSGNWRTEFLRLQLATKLSPEKINALWPQIDFKDEIKRNLSALLPAKSAAFLGNLPQISDSGASNSWVIAGSKTKSGKPILANDPHLEFLAPIMWYLADLNTPEQRLSGGTVPGVPFIVLGHNKQIAWGVTSTHPDLQDLFVETVVSGGYESPNGPKAFVERKEIIHVKDAEDVEIMVRETVHGPVISDALPNLKKALKGNQVLALSATFLRPNDRSPDAYFGINTARTLAEFKKSLRLLQAPHLSVTYADTSGNIARFLPGLLPKRSNNRGQFPQLGTTPVASLAQELDAQTRPGNGYIVEANSKTVSKTYPHFISGFWAPGYRTDRITSLLKSTSSHTPGQSWKIMTDNISPLAKQLLPLMLKFISKESEAGRILNSWDGEMSRDKVAPTLFMSWLRELNIDLYGDELGELTARYLRLRPRFVEKVLTQDQVWCDDIRTIPTETCVGIVGGAWVKTVVKLKMRFGRDISKWTWGKVHRAHFRHPVFSAIPLLDKWANLSIPSDGGAFTVNRGNFRLNRKADPFRHTHGAGIRTVYDLADLNNSGFVIATGQSGNILSPHYRDFLTDWRDNRSVQFAADKMELRRRSAKLLTLLPQEKSEEKAK
jgi:penicillin G amidase